MQLRRAGVPEERRTALFADITSRLAALPGVASAAQAFIVPVSGSEVAHEGEYPSQTVSDPPST